MGSIWKNGGKEDKVIERLISEGKITKNTTAARIVLVAVCVPTGAQNVKCELNNDGTSVTV